MRYKSIPALTPEQLERFWNKVEVNHPAGCWEWSGKPNTHGYGVFWLQHQGFMAHRVTRTLLVGDLAEDQDGDHMCRNHRCCNPDHIRPCSHDENLASGYGLFTLNGRKTHCNNGHEFTPENTYIDYPPNRKPRRVCRECKRSRYDPVKRSAYYQNVEKDRRARIVVTITARDTNG
jgi:hypothetical protein